VLDTVASVPALATVLPDLLDLPTPSVIFMGGCYDRNEFDQARALKGARSLPWIRPKYIKPGEEEALAAAKALGTPSAEVLAAKVKGMIDEYFKQTQGTDEVEEGIWYG